MRILDFRNFLVDKNSVLGYNIIKQRGAVMKFSCSELEDIFRASEYDMATETFQKIKQFVHSHNEEDLTVVLYNILKSNKAIIRRFMETLHNVDTCITSRNTVLFKKDTKIIKELTTTHKTYEQIAKSWRLSPAYVKRVAEQNGLTHRDKEREMFSNGDNYIVGGNTVMDEFIHHLGNIHRETLKQYVPARERGFYRRKLKALRIRYGLSQREVAEIIGSCREHYAQVENGRKTPQIRMLLRLAALFNTSRIDLLLELQNPDTLETLAPTEMLCEEDMKERESAEPWTFRALRIQLMDNLICSQFQERMEDDAEMLQELGKRRAEIARHVKDFDYHYVNPHCRKKSD